MIETIAAISGICGGLVTISAFITLVLKKPKEWFSKEIKQIMKDELGDKLSSLEEKLGDNKEASLAALRHSITAMYDEWITKGYLPKNVKKDLISLYNAYEKNDGNSYVKELYNELIELEVKEN